MKITIVLGAFLPVPPVMGGAVEKSWYALAGEFAAHGHDVTLISRAMPQFASFEVLDGVRHIRVRGFDAPRSLVWLKVLDLVYSLRVQRVLPPADILVTNTFWLPILRRDDKFGQLYISVGRYPKRQMRLYGHAARLQAPSREVADAIRREVPGLDAKVATIPYPGPQTPRDEPPLLSERDPTLLYVGRVHPEKGVHLLVDAFARLSGSDLAAWQLMIIGPTRTESGGGGQKYSDQLRRLASTALDRVFFAGPLFDERALTEKFRRARVFVYPSLAVRGETFGLAPLEAMTHGCAVLVSNLRCFCDFIVPDQTGFIFDQNASDPTEALASALRAATADPICLVKIAAAGWRKSEEFARPRIADRFLADFESINRNAERASR